MRFSSAAIRVLSLLLATTVTLSDAQTNNNNHQQNNNPGYDDEPVRLIFKYRNQRGKSEAAALGRLNTDIPGLSIASVSTTQRNWRSLEANPNIESVDVDEEVHTLDITSSFDHKSFSSLRGSISNAGDGRETSQRRKLSEETIPYGITMVQANDPGLPSIPLFNEYPKMKICIVDTGYDLGHPDLPSSNINGFVPPAYLYDGQRWDIDGHSHGTHVAGTIGAIGGNGIGVNSIMSDPNKFSFFIGKGLSDSGSGFTSSVLEAVQACAANGAKVINLSLGGSAFSTTERDAYRNVFNQGVLLVAAAGNSNDSTYNYPASYPDLISVASVDSNEGKSSYSQYNDQIELAAPGRAVNSTLPNGLYGTRAGTSMASPHVAGVAALVWSYFPQCSNVQIRNVLFKTAKDKGTTGCDIYYGAGIVQAKAAYDLLLLEGCEAGGITPATPSDGSFGGCEQGLPPPPPPPPSPPVDCTLAVVGESCRDGLDCCSGICSGGKPNQRVCLSNGGGDGGSNNPPAPPNDTCSEIGKSCIESVNCCSGLLCTGGRKSSRVCFDPSA